MKLHQPDDEAPPGPDEVNRLWQHGMHEERLFHDRLNYFSAMQVGLLGVFAIMYNKDPALGVFLPLTAVALAHATRDPRLFGEYQLLEQNVLFPLLQATKSEKSNARLYAKLAYWWGVHWEWTSDKQSGRNALTAANVAKKLDPLGTEPIDEMVDLLVKFARYSEGEAVLAPTVGKSAEAKKEAQDNYGRAAAQLRSFVANDPTDAPLRFRLAELLVKAGDMGEARVQAREALRLDERSTLPPRKLTDPQRTQARAWASAKVDD